jgi:hypothetical protein
MKETGPMFMMLGRTTLKRSLRVYYRVGRRCLWSDPEQRVTSQLLLQLGLYVKLLLVIYVMGTLYDRLANCSDESSLVDHHGTHPFDTVGRRHSAQCTWTALAITLFLWCSDRFCGWIQHSCSACADHRDHSHRVLLDRVQSHQM